MEGERLTYEQIDHLARSVAVALMDSEHIIAPLMLLVREIGEHPFDTSHVETVANLYSAHLFGISREELCEKVWSTPATKLAKEFGMSDWRWRRSVRSWMSPNPTPATGSNSPPVGASTKRGFRRRV
jgi:hypothetical protein